MSPGLNVTLRVAASAALVAGVLWWMWRMPPASERARSWSPWLALLSAWMGLAALAGTGMLWWGRFPDAWVVALFLGLDPAAVTAGTLVLWLERGASEGAGTASRSRRAQAVTGIVLGLTAVAAGYFYVFTHKTIFTPTGQ